MNKSKEYGNDFKSSKSSGIKGTLSIEAWVDQVAKKINDSNLNEAKEKLLSEARNSEFYKKEYNVIVDLEKDLHEISKDVYNNQKLLGEKNKEIIDINSKIELLDKKMNDIKDLYSDMHEDY